jgi:hypothetical protein
MKKLKVGKAIEEMQATTESIVQSHEMSIPEKVDAGHTLNKIIKTADGILRQIKPELKEFAKENEIKKIEGESSIATIGMASTSHISPKKALQILKEAGKLNLFETVFSVRLKEFKQYFGEIDIEKNIDAYGKVMFKDK